MTHFGQEKNPKRDPRPVIGGRAHDLLQAQRVCKMRRSYAEITFS